MWGLDTAALARRFVALGFKAILVQLAPGEARVQDARIDAHQGLVPDPGLAAVDLQPVARDDFAKS